VPKLYITEYPTGAYDAATPVEPAITDQAITFTAGTGPAVASAAFSASTRMVRVVADGICSVAFGGSPTATANNSRMAAGVERLVLVQPGHKVSVIGNS
jgi:hypothetical protein